MLMNDLLRFVNEDNLNNTEHRDLNNKGLIYNVLKQRDNFTSLLASQATSKIFDNSHKSNIRRRDNSRGSIIDD